MFARALYRAIQLWGYPHGRRMEISAMTFDPVDPLEVRSYSMEFANGEEIPKYLAERRVRMLALTHWGRRPIVEYLQRAGSKVLLWGSVEAINEQPYWIAPPEFFRMWDYLRARLLVGTDGLPVNVYYPDEPGTVIVDMLSKGLVDGLVPLMVEARRALGADGWFLDSMMDFDFFGRAPNAPPPRYRGDVISYLVAELRRQDPGAILWGNTVVAQSRGWRGFDVCFAEQFFHANPAVEDAALKLHDGLCLNVQRSSWLAAPGRRWKYLAHAAAMAEVRDLWVCTAQWRDRVDPVWFWV